MELEDLGHKGKWGALMSKYQRGELQKPEVVKLLREGEPVTLEGYLILANIIEGSGKSLKAHRPTKWSGDGLVRASDASVAETAAFMVKVFSQYIADTSLLDDEDVHPDFRKRMEAANRRTKYKNRKRTTPDKEAKKCVADLLGISVTKLYQWLKAVR